MQIIPADQLIDHLSDGARAFVVGSSNEPQGIISALTTCIGEKPLHFVQFPLGGFNTTDFTQLGPNVEFTTVFMTPALKAAEASRLHFLPMQMRAMVDYCASQSFEAVLIQVARDRDGVLRLGPNADFAQAAMARAGCVIAELNSGFVPAAGAPVIDESRIDLAVETDRGLPELAPVAIDETSRSIAAHVADLIRDGDTIQTGIGAIPAAILAALHNHRDLGMHGGLIDDGGMALIESGAMTSARKTVDAGVHVTGMALGTQQLYDWLADRGDVRLVGADTTHEFSVLQQIDNFVSINSAVEVDLQGQVNAEIVGGRQISGTGGALDFMRGARASRGGRSIVALTATARQGAVSRIVSRVEHVTAARTDIDLVVTEHGVADLRYADLAARRDALIAIAAPGFRGELTAS